MPAVGESRAVGEVVVGSGTGDARASDVGVVVVGGGIGDARASVVEEVVVGGGAGDARASDAGEILSSGCGDARASDVNYDEGETLVPSNYSDVQIISRSSCRNISIGVEDCIEHTAGEMEETMDQMDEAPSNFSLTSGWESVEDQYRP